VIDLAAERAMRGAWEAVNGQVEDIQPAGNVSGLDIREMEKQFVAWNSEKGGTAENFVGALYGFIKQKVKREG
jgi:hypothetical protein